MVVHQVEYRRNLDSNGLQFLHPTHYYILLTETTALLSVQEDFSETEVSFSAQEHFSEVPAGCLCYCLPGQRVRLLPTKKQTLVDYLELELNAQNEALLQSLPLPRGRNLPPNASELAMLMKSVYYLFYSADKYRREKLELWLTSFLYATASGDEEATQFSSHTELLYFRLRRLRNRISDEPTCMRTVADAAAYMNLSISRFEYLYHQYFNVSFVNDLIRFRVRRSCSLLLTTEWTIARIATELGYADTNYFYRQFRQQMGMSPREYKHLGVNIVP